MLLSKVALCETFLFPYASYTGARLLILVRAAKLQPSGIFVIITVIISTVSNTRHNMTKREF